MRDSKFLSIAKQCNSFYLSGRFKSKDFKPLFCQSYQIGMVSRKLEQELIPFQDVFVITQSGIDICPGLEGYDEISQKVDSVVTLLREKLKIKPEYRETMDVRPSRNMAPLFAIKRAAMSRFGMLTYGINVNAYVVNNDGSTSIWLQRRSRTCPKFPGKLDSFVAGGIASGETIREAVIKECEEEANLPEHWFDRMKPAGCVSYFVHFKDGCVDSRLELDTQFTFDLELPASFTPTNNDGEVNEFLLVPVAQLIDMICNFDVALSATPKIMDFLIRKGFLTHEIEPDIAELVEILHVPVHQIYNKQSIKGPDMVRSSSTGPQA